MFALISLQLASSYEIVSIVSLNLNNQEKMSVIVVFLYFVALTVCTDDYEFLGKLQKQREARSQSSDSLDGLYSVESAENGLYLTAKDGWYTSPGDVVLNAWSDYASQLWIVTKFDTSRGFSMKPLVNEYNVVTSTVKNNAHAYNVWEFKLQKNESNYIIFNSLLRRCMQTASAKQSVVFEKCQPNSELQRWKLHKLD